MKKSAKTMFYFMVLSTLIVITSSSIAATTNSKVNDQSCRVTVKYKNGSPASYVKVSTEVSGGISCIGGRSFETDKNGVVTLKWAEGCRLTTVYVKGDTYKVDYKNGKSYTLTLKK